MLMMQHCVPNVICNLNWQTSSKALKTQVLSQCNHTLVLELAIGLQQEVNHNALACILVLRQCGELKIPTLTLTLSSSPGCGIPVT